MAVPLTITGVGKVVYREALVMVVVVVVVTMMMMMMMMMISKLGALYSKGLLLGTNSQLSRRSSRTSCIFSLIGDETFDKTLLGNYAAGNN
ncbi:MAG: hypothetical protein N0E59_11210 [Candidatus Thiodiazotropha taylori]|nr:hypothetical protein [Candidatus Thiodiazotropha taylori]MCW4283672.1 hypothetical protein [Candidatus Thiodiazotropha taylori]